MRYCTKILFFWTLSLFCSLWGETLAQQRYWVVFKDKPAFSAQPKNLGSAPADGNCKKHLQNAFLDAPVHQPYLDSLSRRSLSVTGVSKWLNAAAVHATPAQIYALQKAFFVQEIHPITGYLVPAGQKKTLPKFLAKGVAQLNPGVLLQNGLTGKGVKIGVIDAGFYQAPEKPALKALFETGRVKAFRDFVHPANSAPYTQRETFLDFHGTQVLQAIAGYDREQSALTGLAPGADYYLARTDHGSRENRVEEENFVRALEWLDSLGVRLVNSSLGYGTGFDNPAENYRPEQMNGTSFIARAVQVAIDQKGMTIIVSAGNDGDKKNWQLINTPADAQGAIAVGSTDFTSWTRQGYSGIGPDFLPFLKPDLACYAVDGTSFSAPLITGLAACLLEANPSLTGLQLSDILRKSGHLYPFGNNFLGYGVPDAERALALAKDSALDSTVPTPVRVTGSTFTYPVAQEPAADSGGIVLFRKRSATQVIAQQKLPVRTKKIKVTRMAGETHTTVQVGRKVMELVWE